MEKQNLSKPKVKPGRFKILLLLIGLPLSSFGQTFHFNYVITGVEATVKTPDSYVKIVFEKMYLNIEDTSVRNMLFNHQLATSHKGEFILHIHSINYDGIKGKYEYKTYLLNPNILKIGPNIHFGFPQRLSLIVAIDIYNNAVFLQKGVDWKYEDMLKTLYYARTLH